MNELFLAGGSEFQLIVWVVVAIIWGIGQLIARAAKKAQKQEGSTPSTKKPDLRTILDELKKATIQEIAPQPIPVPITPRVEARKQMAAQPQRPTKRPQKKKSVTTGFRDHEKKSVSHQSSSDHSRNSSMVMSTQSATFSGSAGAHICNPLRPKWKNKTDLRKALIASFILTPLDLRK